MLRPFVNMYWENPVDNIQKYECGSDAPDTLTAYTSVQGAGMDSMFAIVCVHVGLKTEQKVSVLLDVEDAQRLRDQLTDHITAALLTPPL